MENKFLEAAIKYVEKYNLSVIPIIPCEKKPLIKWEPYQKRKPTQNELFSWWGANPNANIGIVTGEISDLFVIDCDSDEGNDNLNKLGFDSIITPSVKTPRGGYHLYFKFPSNINLTVGVGKVPGTDFRGNGGYIVAPPSVNGNGHCYEWTVDLATAPPMLLPEAYIKLISTLYTRGDVDNAEKRFQQKSTLSTNVYKLGTRDQDLFHIAHLLVKARCEPKYLHKTLEILALNCDPPFPLQEAQVKIKSALERANRKTRNLMSEVREFVLSTNGVFLSTDVKNVLQLSTREDLKNLSICLRRLEKDEHLIVKHGNKNGSWRTVDQDEELIDYKNVDLSPKNVKLPLGIHELVTIHKGNIIVLAGESNAGKTAFMMNAALSNCRDHKVNYMSSEMQNGEELRIRMDKFHVPIDSWDSIKFQFRTDNFPDKIDPDGLNIIDYLDEGSDEEAHRMPARLRNIADKLNTGIALVSIQKDPNKTFGYGGSGTLNRSRLYMTITTDNVLTIVKGKIWRNENINPNGMFCRFSLAAGCKFKREGDWLK